MNTHLIYNAEIVNDDSRFKGYVVISGDKILSVGMGNPPESVIKSCSKISDIEGKYLLPGVIDDQVHFREPGLTHKADITTESAAAVAGGITSFMDMPNTVPQTVTIEALTEKNIIGAEKSLANYSFYIGATNDNTDILRKIDYTQTCGVKVFLGASTGNMLVDNKNALERIFSEVPALIAIHSEDENIIRANKEMYITRFGNDLPVHFHPLIRSAEACYQSTARAVALADRCGTQLHILHISTNRELSLLDNAPLSEKKITAEVCVHHLWFTDNDYSEYGNRIKWNPAIKTYADREALRTALKDGRIDVVATDHAPHTLNEKRGNCISAASGGPLIQYSLIAMLEMARKGVFTIEQVVRKMCHAPADLYKVDKRGYIREGYFADLVVVEPGVSFTVKPEDIISKCEWSPFDGMSFHNKICRTYVNGNVAYEDGAVNYKNRGEMLRFDR